MAGQDERGANGHDGAANELAGAGLPGGGAGRRDDVGRTGIYPLSNAEGSSDDAQIVSEGALGQSDRGIEGYEDSGGGGFDDTFGDDSASAGGMPGDADATSPDESPQGR